MQMIKCGCLTIEMKIFFVFFYSFIRIMEIARRTLVEIISFFLLFYCFCLFFFINAFKLCNVQCNYVEFTKQYKRTSIAIFFFKNEIIMKIGL